MQPSSFRNIAAAALLAATLPALAVPTYVATEIPTFGTPDQTGLQSSASAINAQGQVAGMAEYPYGAPFNATAIIFAGGVLRSLGTLGGANSYATGINARGDVVGYSSLLGGGSRPFL